MATSATIMEERENIRWVLDEAAEFLCKDLNPAAIIRMLKGKHILDDGDEAVIKSEIRPDDKIDRLLAILKRKPPKAYREFMNALRRDREDLYEDVKKIEETAAKRSIRVATSLGDIFIPSGDVKIGKSLGNGGFGCVHLATHKMWGTVAVKRFEKVVLTDNIRREAEKMVRGIRSPYIVRIMALIEESPSLSIVMEYVENGNLKIFQRKYMDCNCWARKVKMLLDISLGMNYLHTLDPPVLHLDLKLENVFVGNGFEAKVGDLGLAMHMTETSAQRYLTADAQGTPSHIPPEGWEVITTQKAPDKFWDVFMFAITTFELLSGKDAWPPIVTAMQISVGVRENKRPDLSEIPTEAPSELIDIMKQCWKGRSTDRPQFQEIQEKISGIYQTRYEKDIHAANIAISQRIREVDSLESGFQQLKLGGDQTSSTHDSGLGSSGESHTTLTQAKAAPTEAHSVQQWRIVKQFGKEGDGQGEFKMAAWIAVCNNQDIVVVDFDLERVYLFSKDYEYKFTLVSPKGNPKAQLLFPVEVAVTSQGHIAVVESCTNPEIGKYVKVFSVNGTYLHSFSTIADDESYTKISSCSIAVAADGKILVGDIARKCVTIHAGSDGGLIQKVNLDIQPLYLATNRHHHIYACDWQALKVVAVDYSGTTVFILESFRVDGEKGFAEGLACGDDDTLYIAVVKFNESNGKVFTNTGHIHQYSPEGRFMGCLIKGLYHPRGITWHNDSLYVANDKSVVILGKSSSP